jgi:triosephosphate isomerase (TIM)
MKNKKRLIVANWKMNPNNLETAKEIFKKTKAVAKDLKNITVVICPPFVYLSDLEKISQNSSPGGLTLGAQDMFWAESGSFTGEISALMLKGENYVILGHSERRELGETDQLVAKKLLAAFKAGLKPILCIGEKERDVHGEYLHFLRRQLSDSLGKLSKKFLANLVIAYEPIWAIGKDGDEAMKPADIYETALFIKKVLADIFGSNLTVTVPVLYGGSVDFKNARDIIMGGEVQGLLVGHESLKVERFAELLKNVDQS